MDTTSLESKAVNSVPLKLKVVDEPKQANKGQGSKPVLMCGGEGVKLVCNDTCIELNMYR